MKNADTTGWGDWGESTQANSIIARLPGKWRVFLVTCCKASRNRAQSSIAKCDVFIVILGLNTHQAPGVLKEVQVAKGLRKRRFQLKPQGTNPTRVKDAGPVVNWTRNKLKTLLGWAEQNAFCHMRITLLIRSKSKILPLYMVSALGFTVRFSWSPLCWYMIQKYGASFHIVSQFNQVYSEEEKDNNLLGIVRSQHYVLLTHMV